MRLATPPSSRVAASGTRANVKPVPVLASATVTKGGVSMETLSLLERLEELLATPLDEIDPGDVVAVVLRAPEDVNTVPIATFTSAI
jgi:hypothetical protein